MVDHNSSGSLAGGQAFQTPFVFDCLPQMFLDPVKVSCKDRMLNVRKDPSDALGPLVF